ncbi:MAG TPA: MFS transporter [Dehalococcoidia bacterium]|nr:MFS transporter [Dehalococcoidia bacterium]
MYTLIRENLPFSRPQAGLGRKPRIQPVSSTVVLLGLTSLITDISSEMVNTILPLYFIYFISLTPLHFGIIDGLYQGFAAPLRLLGALIADRTRRYKEIATFGYAISAVCKLGFLLVGSVWLMFTAVLLIDRSGKGLRTSPRDAMISFNSPRKSLGTAFGVHRAMDTLGALLGPLIAFFILQMTPGAFKSIFFISFCVALIGVSVIALFVENRPTESNVTPAPEPEPAPKLQLRETLGLLARPQILKLVVIAGLLALFTISDAFLYLVLQRQFDLEFGFFPLLYVGTACVYFVLAIPIGWLSDRIGRGKVLTGGYVLLLLVYTALLRTPGGTAEVGIYLVLFGAYYAATDGVLMAIASTHLAEATRASGMALLTTVTSLARFFGSVMFGALWTWKGADTATATLLAGLLVATIAAAVFLTREEKEANVSASAA